MHKKSAMRRSFDVILLFILLIARLRINSFAESSLFEHFENVARHPLLGGLLSDRAIAAFSPWFGDPIFLILAAVSLLAFLGYVLFDLFGERLGEQTLYRVKMVFLWTIIVTLVVLPTLKLALLRHDNLPQSYSHDGGVIQTEVTIDYFLSGRNPYIETYYDTPMAEWGFPEFRTALEHYPYLPATFILSAPFKLISDFLLGWYDQRFVYLVLFILMLLTLPGLAGRKPASALGLTMVVALNPIMGLDIVVGQNDVFVLALLVFSLWLLHKNRLTWSAILFGVACAAKPTAWFLAPFWLLVWLPDANLAWKELPARIMQIIKRGLPALVAFLVLTLPYLIWNADAMIDDVWRWSAGTTPMHYQIWGWGFANFVLTTGALSDRFALWPFWIPELLIGIPILIGLLNRQLRENSAANACWHGAILLLAFAYFSRFLNENYLGFILALLTIGYYWYQQPKEGAPASRLN